MTRQLAAPAELKRDAEAALLAKSRTRGMKDIAALKAYSPFSDAARLWLAKVEAGRRESTYDT